ncbi:helix-turn-helix domain-containing protein [Streptomyces griseus]|uniref:helix-turn-helix domain-containing protein n=1 Tax=Streptomyces griseus TaxID=1911 RepID=UPI00084005B4|nr:helix-turn-helix transcriptional regulator [Streptomyces griseus]
MGTEIQDFAAELSGLKERSGLSYGALARKLHMSTSTVHRYCNGDAVPPDYAPVERFARVCRATPDELVGLHRKWILADEAKRRGARKAGAGAAAEPAAAAEPGPGPSESVTRHEEPEPEPEPEPESTPEPEPEPVPEGAQDAGRGAVRESGPRPVEGPVSGPAPGDVEAAEESRAPAGAEPARRPSRRRRVLLAAVALVALTVPAALVVRGLTHDVDGLGRTEAADVTVPVVPSVSGNGSRTAGVSATPSPPVSPSAGDSPSAFPSSPSSASAGAPARQGGGADGRGVPVSAVISSYNWESPCGQYYLLDRDPGTVPPPPAPQDTRSWARALGGVDGGDMLLELTLQGTSREAVVLKDLHVRVVGREPALTWPAFSMGDGCGSGITPQTFDIDLDENLPRSRPVAGQHGDVVVPAKDFPYRVSSTDVEVFDLDAHVEGHDVTWYLELEWSSGGRSGTLRIDDNGKPFRTSSLTGRPEYRYRPDTARWEEPEL